MIYLARKGTDIVHHTSLKAMKALDGIDKPDLTITEAVFEAAGGLVRFIGGKIVIGKTQAELNAETELAGLTAEEKALQKELADKDYKVVKAAEDGLVLAKADPELHKRREWCRSRITEIRVRIAELNPQNVA